MTTNRELERSAVCPWVVYYTDRDSTRMAAIFGSGHPVYRARYERLACAVGSRADCNLSCLQRRLPGHAGRTANPNISRRIRRESKESYLEMEGGRFEV